MCGIIGYTGHQDPKGVLLDGLKRLEYRGYDSAGLAIFEQNKLELFRCEGRIQKLEERLGSRHFKGSVGIGHTRWATHGAPTEVNAHPHRVGNITLVHNGIVENYLEHKEHILKLGRKIASETDTEIVAHLFDIEVESGKSLTDAIKQVLPKLKGSYAFVVLSEKEPDLVIGVRNGAPLLVGVGDKESFIASDVQAILHRTNRIIYLKDHQFTVCNRNDVKIFEEKGKPVQAEVKTIHWTPDQMDKAGYRHYMLKEIHEQPQAVTHTIDGNIDHNTGILSLGDLAPWAERLKKLEHISIVACGTARHAGLIGKYYLERMTRLPVEVDFGSEFRYRDPVLEENTLCILISQSGETADTLAAQREAAARKIPTLSICNVRESTLARESDIVLYTNAGPEIGVASTKAFTTQLTLMYMFAVQLGHLRGSLSTEQAKEYSTDLLRLPILMDKVLQTEAQIEKIAEEHQSRTFFFYMGRGVNYPISLEGALKLKEISYLHAEGYPAGELKHGPIALVDRQTAVIVLGPKDKVPEHDPKSTSKTASETLYEKLMSNIQEVRSRSGKIFSIGTEGDSLLTKQSEYFVGIPSASWAINPILLSVPLQLFAYYIALQRGTDVDKPRNLAKSVTVE
jgi:glutamine---fructose-6-phosphate transaminase (isomerizing)